MNIHIRDARPKDARRIAELTAPYAMRRILLRKGLITYFEDIQEFVVVIDEEMNALVGCGALHVMWSDIAEIHTLTAAPKFLHKGIDSVILGSLLARARKLGPQRVFYLILGVDFFTRHGFYEVSDAPVGEDAFPEMLRSHDDGVREFLDLTSYKPSTLGNTRMLHNLENSPLSKATSTYDTNSVQVSAHSSET